MFHASFMNWTIILSESIYYQLNVNQKSWISRRAAMARCDNTQRHARIGNLTTHTKKNLLLFNFFFSLFFVNLQFNDDYCLSLNENALNSHWLGRKTSSAQWTKFQQNCPAIIHALNLQQQQQNNENPLFHAIYGKRVLFISSNYVLDAHAFIMSRFNGPIHGSIVYH